LDQGCFGVTLEQGQGEETEKIGIGEGEVVFAEGLVAVSDPMDAITGQAHGIQDFGEVSLEGSRYRRHHVGFFYLPAIHFAAEDHPDYPVGFLVKTVKAQFVLDKEHDQQKGGDPQGKAQDMDEGGGLVPPEVSKGNPKKVLKHACRFIRLLDNVQY